MNAENNESTPLLVKLALYVGGVIVGLAAKLATLNMEKALSFKEIMFHSAVAFACAWVVGFALFQFNMKTEAMIASVIVGRFGDSMLIAIGKAVKKGILNIFKAD